MNAAQRATLERLSTPAGITEITGRQGTETILAKTIIAPGDRFAVYSIAADGSYEQHASEPFTANPAWSTPEQLEAELAQKAGVDIDTFLKENSHNV